MTLSTLLLFLGASMALTIVPGPDNILVVTQGVARGRRAAVVTAWGMCSGITVHTLAAAAGISALFNSSAVAFRVVKYAGALYLLYLAWKMLRERDALTISVTGAGFAPSLSALYRRGFIMNVLNPKVALFFLAFLPQFTVREAGNVPLQMALLGFVFMAQALVIFTLIGLFSGTVGVWLRQRPGAGCYLTRLAGGIFALLGLRLALMER